jgi:hypothetical protein
VSDGTNRQVHPSTRHAESSARRSAGRWAAVYGHNLAVDSKGNGLSAKPTKKLQKFAYTGLGRVRRRLCNGEAAKWAR